jgi:hypothetical protein
MSTLNELIQKINQMKIPRPSSGIQVSHQENDHPLHCRCAKCKSNHDERASNVESVKSIFSPKAIRAKTLPNRASYRNLAEYLAAMREINAQNPNAQNSNVQNPNARRANVGEQKSDPNGTTRFVDNHRSRQSANVNKIIKAMQKQNKSRPAWAQPPVLTFKPKQNESDQNIVQPVLKKTPSE